MSHWVNIRLEINVITYNNNNNNNTNNNIKEMIKLVIEQRFWQ